MATPNRRQPSAMNQAMRGLGNKKIDPQMLAAIMAMLKNKGGAPAPGGAGMPAGPMPMPGGGGGAPMPPMMGR